MPTVLSDNRTFTLLSTPTFTARIGPMGIDAELRGQITWQRSLRTGPAGWRYIATPIKGQSLANINDDVWIQGIAEDNPQATFTNIGTYSEPLGTTGANGLDGWVNFTSNANPLVNGKGMKLWLWADDYVSEVKIINSGHPVIGNGVDNIAGSGEVFNFPLSFTASSLNGGGWNFLANPYPSELDWNSPGFAKSVLGIAGNAVYIWNPINQELWHLQWRGRYKWGDTIYFYQARDFL